MTLRLTALAAALLALTACQPSGQTAQEGKQPAASAAAKIQGETLTVETARGEAVVPKNPQRIAVYDLGMIDILSKLGVPIGASIDKNRLPYLDAALKDAQKAGTLFEPNYEVLNAYKPDLIIIGSRAAKAFDQLSQIAPTIEMTADTAHLKDSAKARIDAFARIFGKEAEAEKVKGEIDAAFEAAKAAAKGKGKGLVVLVNGGKMSAFGSRSRLGGWIHQDIGIEPADASINEKGTHGQPVTFEYLQKTNPDWLFVLDRTAAIGQEAKAAKDVLDNPLVAQTTAWKKGQVVYLVPETYLAAGGAQELIHAADQVTEAFKAAK